MAIDTPDVRPPELDEHVSPAMQRYLMVIAGAQRDGLAADRPRPAALLGPAVSSNLESRLRDVRWPSTRPCRPAED